MGRFRRISIFLIFLALLFLLTACPGRMSNVSYYPSPEEPTPTITIQQPAISAPQASPAPTPEPTPEPILPPERRAQSTPYLVRLMPYTGDLYTDGMNTFLFMEDGTVEVDILHGRNIILDHKPPQTMQLSKFYDTDDFRLVSEIAASYMGWEHWDGMFQIIYVQGDNFILHRDGTRGGGSGESFYHADDAHLFQVSTDGDVMDFGQLRAVHIIWHDEFLYYMELADRILGTHGTGSIMRIDANGGNKTVIVDEITIGPFQIVNGRIFYSNLYGVVYSVDLNGNDKIAIDDRIAPRYHRPGLAFYGSTIINRFWGSFGFSISTGVFPNDLTRPAIFCLNGGCLITFPHELVGLDPYTVIVWGYENPENADSWPGSRLFMIIRSNNDDSYWIYSRRCMHNWHAEAFIWAREQHNQ